MDMPTQEQTTINFNFITPLLIYTLVPILFASPALYSDESKYKIELELNSIVIDQTITSLGHEFYTEFSRIWEPPKNILDYNLSIGERPSARWGNRIWIKSQNRILYQTTVRPGRNHTAILAKKAAAEIIQKMLLNNIQRRQLNKDIAEDEI